MKRTLMLLLLVGSWGAYAADTTPAQLQAQWTATAGTTPSPARGQQFFSTTHGGEWSCASCHGAVPTADGKHASTGKRIAPLAPAYNPRALTDTAKVDKWFRRNCKDVLSRECTAAEKADVLSWLNSIK